MKIILVLAALSYDPVFSRVSPKATSMAGSSSERIIKFHKQIVAGDLQAQLVAAGFSVKYIECADQDCLIHMPLSETKDPAAIIAKYVYVDPLGVRKKRLAAMQELWDKWQANTITPAEKDELLKMLVQQVLGK